MSEKKYDLSQVSQATKDAYLEAVIDFDCKGSIKHHVLREASHALYNEAEVKPPEPKTAREILEEYIASPTESDIQSEFRQAIVAIFKALEVLP